MSKGDPGAFFKNEPKLAALARAFMDPYKRWGDEFYKYDEEEKTKMSSAERRKIEQARKNKLAALEKAGAEAEEAKKAELSRFQLVAAAEAEKKKAANSNKALEQAIKKHVAKQFHRYTNKNTKVLIKIAKKCKWECQGEKCWAHNAKACPFIHKGDPGWDEKSAVPLSAGAGTGVAAGQGKPATGAKAATGKKRRAGGSSRKQRRNVTRRRRQ